MTFTISLSHEELNPHIYYNCKPEIITTISFKLFSKIFSHFSDYELRELRLVCKTFDSFIVQMLPTKCFTLIRTDKQRMFLLKERPYSILRPKRYEVQLDEVLNLHANVKVDKVQLDLTKNPDTSILTNTILEQTVEQIEVSLYDVHDAHKFFNLRVMKRSVKSLVLHGATYYIKRLLSDFLQGGNVLELLSDGERTYSAPEIRRQLLSDMRKCYPGIKTELD
uniref:F-box domain-containing protein n=1 Tax=Steinernema glaseri TaxID=37863 RepID=A0A1I7Y4Z1_9BILA